MVHEHSPALVLPRLRHEAAAPARPLAWRLALPLIASASAGLWLLLAKAIACLGV